MTHSSKAIEIGKAVVVKPQAEVDFAEPPMNGEIQEQRKWERLPTAIQLRLRKFEPMSWRSGVCVDIGDGGLGLQTLEPLKVGELVEVELLGPDGVVHVCGRIVHRCAHRYGLSFLGFSRLPAGANR